MLASAEAAVALGQPGVYGDDNIANKTNDINGAATLAAALRESKLAPSIVDDALSAAIAKGLNESTEATAVLVASAVMTDNSTAVTTTAEGIKQVSVLLLAVHCDLLVYVTSYMGIAGFT